MSRPARETAAAVALRECRAELAVRGSSSIGEAAGRVSAVEAWRHYPDGEVYDPLTHVQYFFHRHAGAPDPRGRGPQEFGHFHVFLRGEAIPAGMRPLLFADRAVAGAPPAPQSAPLRRGRCEEVCHLIAIAVDAAGEAIGLFTTNRWVTGETWYRAADLVRLIERVGFDEERPTSLLDRWIAALVRLFADDIAALLHARDKAILDWRWRRPRANVFEDPRLEVTSGVAIDLDARLAAIEADRVAPAAMPVAWGGGAAAIADGWGR